MVQRVLSQRYLKVVRIQALVAPSQLKWIKGRRWRWRWCGESCKYFLIGRSNFNYFIGNGIKFGFTLIVTVLFCQRTSKRRTSMRRLSCEL
ncbi:hypothetical protein OIU74_000661 [Salix koriyanagi]|uniref:Uncharacterized protein n=1 Tax=Salix koriyanagi TaxID=2511006 RepID=A0A9Q0X0H1_9ROSI|nr:hypothetical protein OIU74_000661 [Salix koriyanagi]